jgi:hypothetical protein
MTTQKAKPDRASRAEARLDRAVRRFTGKGPEAYSAEDWISTREMHRLPVL